MEDNRTHNRHGWGRRPWHWLQRLVERCTASEPQARLPDGLARLDDRLLRDIGFDPQLVPREMPLEALLTGEHWYPRGAADLIPACSASGAQAAFVAGIRSIHRRAPMPGFDTEKASLHGHAVLRLAAFSNGATGGNPAGVVLAERLPAKRTMQDIARAVGDSETVFACRDAAAWQVRYFSPTAEIPFCGHATLALGAALAMRHGPSAFDLVLADGQRVNVCAEPWQGLHRARVVSPPTRSAAEDHAAVHAALALFGLAPHDLDGRLPPARIHAGSDHLAIALASREALAAMRYDFAAGQALMRRHGWVTVMLYVARSGDTFDARHAFAYGGVVEDPATGAGAAALAGYLRDIGWMSSGSLRIRQGDDMQVPCRIEVGFSAEPGSPVSIAGTVRAL